MLLPRIAQLCALIAVFAGCKAVEYRASATRLVQPSLEASSETTPLQPRQRAEFVEPTSQQLATVSFQQENLRSLPPARAVNDSNPSAELSLTWLVDQVQSRNPSLEAMAAAWRAAAERYPQAVSLEDPMFMAMAAPASFGSDEVEPAYALQLNQKLPWFGKRAARGRQAAAEATAAYHELEDSRLRLDEVVQMAFFEYYLARRSLDLNQENTQVMEGFRSTAQAKYRANQVTQQDELQAAVELAQLQRQRLRLERMDKVATARINTLLRASPFERLPPPPKTLSAPTFELDTAELQALAESQRPDLAALAAQVRAEQAAVTLACKDYYPDVDVFGRYDTFWQPEETQSELRPQVGATINLPLYKGKLSAAVREAIARLNQRRAEYEQRRLDVSYEVANESALVEESRKTVALYTDALLPASQQNIAAASANYDVGKVTFSELATAQRQVIELRREKEEAIAAYHSRLAELSRVVGGALPGVEKAH
jgi:outer membrane protein, heavy metal efflux system